MKKFLSKPFLILLLLLAALSGSLTAQTVKRDYLTPEEIEIVRDVQELDKRTQVFVKSINRRFLALGSQPTANELKVQKKDDSAWGELPKGSRAELLMDIARILEAAMDNIDDVYSRDAKSKLIAPSIKTLSEAAQNILNQIKSFDDKSVTDAEREAIYQIRHNAEMILETQKEFKEAS